MTRKITVACSIVLFALGSAALAQEASGPSDAERLEAAKQEQESLRSAEKKAAQDEARAAADAEEAARQERLGIAGAEPPPEELPGFFLQAEAGWMELQGADRVVARQFAIESAAVTAEDLDSNNNDLPDAFSRGAGTDLELSYDGQFAPGLELGWRRKEGGVFSVRWSAFSSDASLAAASSRRFASADPARGDLILGGIDTPGLESTSSNVAAQPGEFTRPFGSPLQLTEQGLHGADSVEATGTLESTRIDLLYSRTALARKRTEAIFRVGLTYFDVSREEDAAFTWTSYSRGQVFNQRSSAETVSAACETSGVGVTAGVAGRWSLTASRRLTLRAGLDVAGVQASQELRFRNSHVVSQAGLPDQSPDIYQDTTTEDASQFVSIVEADAALEYRWGQRARLAVGYRAGTWLGALVSEQYPSAVSASPSTSETLDLDAMGPYVRLGVFF